VELMQPPGACPACGRTDRLFTPNACREPYGRPPHYESAWQCVACGHVEFLPSAVPGPAADLVADFLKPVQIDDQGRLWLAADCGDWGPIVREHRLTAVFDLEEGLDRGIPAHPDSLIYAYFPIKDEGLPGLHKLHAIARLGAELMREGERVLVHCEMGLNRSALLAGLMLVYTGLSGADAVALLQARRPGALYNERFADHLERQPPGGGGWAGL
jgi:hypothetical protein